MDEQHPLTQLVIQCLGNEPSERPSAEEILRQLESMRGQIESAYEHLTKLEMMKKLEDKDAKAQQVQVRTHYNVIHIATYLKLAVEYRSKHQ